MVGGIVTLLELCGEAMRKVNKKVRVLALKLQLPVKCANETSLY